MKLSFLPGDLHLNQERDGMYLVIMQGHEVLRTRVEKKALAKFNALRRELEAQVLEVGHCWHKMTDDDFKSVFAFLQTLKPIKHQAGQY